jgi:hypothetical protein
MRAREILSEGEKSTLDSDIEDLLVAAKANGLDQLDTEDLVNQLNSMGHSVTPDSLLDMLNNRDDEFIKNATLTTISLKLHTGGEGEGEENEWDDESPEEHTARLANKSAMKRIRDRAKAHKKAAKDIQL